MSAPRPRKSPAQRRSAHTVDAIVEAAIRILGTDGYAALNTRRVADVAGVSVGSLYQYFPNRESIVAELVRRRMDDFVASIEDAELGAAPTMREAVGAMVAAFLAEKRRTLELSRAVLDAMGDTHGRQLIAERLRGATPALAKRLGDACGTPVDERRLAMAFAAVEGATWQAVADDVERIASAGFEATLVGIAMAVLET
ncbi:MAG: TetR/AcrR family transcriptional regulator [Reyranellaceae bacterium]